MSGQNQRGNQTIINNYAPQQPVAQQYDCPYCGSRVAGVPSQNGLSSLSCPNCGGALQANNAVQSMQSVGQSYSTPGYSTPGYSTPNYQASPSAGPDYRTLQARQGGCVTKLVGFIAVIIIIAVILLFVFKFSGNNYSYSNNNNTNYSYSHEDSIYVSALGRTVYWDNEYDSYYDQETDCYFLLNQDMNPPIWQYWFEGVSSKYGDYGWMEWDDDERCWYIETGNNSWKKLPEAEYTNNLWHME